MPQLLKNGTIRLLESSVENLNFCIEAIQKPQRIPIHDENSYLSIPTGLLGISFELFCSSLIVQIYSEKQLLLKVNGYFKSASQIFEDLKYSLKNPTPKLAFLTQGINDKNNFYLEMLSKINEFTLLSKLRASSVHGAKAPSREVIIVYINKMIDLLNLVKKSERISGYLLFVPRLNMPIVNNNIIIEELINKIKKSKDISESANILISLFLVLPEIPTYKPEWLDKIENVRIAPKEDDLNFLLKVLDDCESVNFIKNKSSELSLAVSIQPGNSSAIPIDPHYIKKEFTKFKDQFYADIATANGRLLKKQLDLPSIESVYYLLATKIENIDDRFLDSPMVHQDSWPFIIRSLSQQGTIGPYWYFIRKTENLNQLKTLLNKALSFGSGYLKNDDRKKELLSGLELIRNSNSKEFPKNHFMQLKEMVTTHVKEQKKFNDLVNQQYFSNQYPKYFELFSKINDTDIPACSGIDILIHDNEIQETQKLLWLRHLVDITDAEEDFSVLNLLISDQKYKTLFTNIRKAFRRIDFLCYGPPINLEI